MNEWMRVCVFVCFCVWMNSHTRSLQVSHWVCMPINTNCCGVFVCLSTGLCQCLSVSVSVDSIHNHLSALFINSLLFFHKFQFFPYPFPCCRINRAMRFSFSMYLCNVATVNKCSSQQQEWAISTRATQQTSASPPSLFSRRVTTTTQWWKCKARRIDILLFYLFKM